MDEFIEVICEYLKIDVPKISYDCSGFTSETMMAQVDPNTNIIYIKKSEKENPDQLLL